LFQRLLKNFDKKTPKTTTLIAVSGGIDSMLLATLYKAAGRKFAIAHCNFQLRGAESDADEQFLKAWARANEVNCYVTNFDTASIATERKQSIQLVARNLRYAWLEQLRKDLDFVYIATAHHANDNLETLIFNVSRGASIKGMAGIPPQTGQVIRPLLTVPKADILAAAIAENIAWRDDSSNATDKYSRNKIRHQIVPILAELNPNIANTVTENSARLRDVLWLYNYATAALKNEYFAVENEVVIININSWKMLPVAETLLYEWIANYGFSKTQITDILAVNEGGKRFLTDNYEAVWRKGKLFITAKN
jgi:tRNA(Ile)-lysidine synthase